MDFENLIAQLMRQGAAQHAAEAGNIHAGLQTAMTEQQMHRRNATAGGVLDAGGAQFGRAYTDGVRKGAAHAATPPTRASVGLDVINASPPAYQPGIVRGARPPMDLDIGPATIQPAGLDIGPARFRGEPGYRGMDLDIGPARIDQQARKGGSVSGQDHNSVASYRPGTRVDIGDPHWTLQAAGPEGMARLREDYPDTRLNDRAEPEPEWMHGPHRSKDERGPVVMAPQVYAGEGSRTGYRTDPYAVPLPDTMSSGDIQGIRRNMAKPTIDERGTFDIMRGHDPKTGEPIIEKNAGTAYSDDPLDMVSPASMQRDDDVSQTGWLPSDFDGMSHAQAMAVISDQLRAHRIRTLRESDPEYLGTLPKY